MADTVSAACPGTATYANALVRGITSDEIRSLREAVDPTVREFHCLHGPH